MSFLVTVVVLVVVVVSIVIGARIVGARNTGIGAALLTAVVLSAVGWACDRFFGYRFGWVFSSIAGGFVIAAILGTTFWRGLGVSIIAAAIQVGIALLAVMIVV